MFPRVTKNQKHHQMSKQTQTSTRLNSTAPQFVQGDASLAAVLGVDLSTVRSWRRSRVIPYTKTGHRTIVYNVAQVLAALERFEVKRQRDAARAEVQKPHCEQNGDATCAYQLMHDAAIKERDAARAELEKLCADHDALGNDMDAVCVERDEARELSKELKTELNYALSELHQARANTRPEPSRLEIAAMLMMHGWADRSLEQDTGLMLAALTTADALIAAAKEVAK